MKDVKKYMTFIISLIALLFIMQFSTSVIFAADSYIKVVDPDTSYVYENKLITEEKGSKNAGRLWTDKSVFDPEKGSKELVIEKDGIDAEITTEEDFLHEYSLLDSSQIINEEAPLDVMFVIDISVSMGEQGGTISAIYRSVNALNNSIKQLIEDNPNARFGVVAFASKAAVIMELGSYRPLTEGSNIVKVSYYPGTSQSFFYLEFNYFDIEKNTEEKIKLTNNDDLPELKEKTWKNVVTDEPAYGDFIINGGETNIQAGIKAGLENLAQQQDTVVDSYLPNRKVSRIPAMILLTDGAANTMANVSNLTVLKEGERKKGIETFYDCDGAIGTANYNFTTFDIGEDLGHSNNYFALYGNDGNYGDMGDSTTPATIGLASSEKSSALPDYDPVILNTLLTASYYTSAVNNNYRSNAEKYNATNLNNIKLQNYVIYTYTKGDYFSSDQYGYITQKVINPEQYFNDTEYNNQENIPKLETENKAYQMYKEWIEESNPLVEEDLYSFYYIADNSLMAGFYFFEGVNSKNMEERSVREYYEALAQYDENRDGDYASFENELYFYYMNEYSKDHFGYPTEIKTKLTLSLSDIWFNDPVNNPYNITKDNIKENINYVTKDHSKTVASSLIEDTFKSIIEELTGTAFLAVRGTNSLGVDDSITYMDPIGQYMEVKDNKRTSIKKGNSTTNSDMALLLNGNIYSYTKAAVYNYSFNYKYGMEQRETDPSYEFEEGWYKETIDNSGKTYIEYRPPNSPLLPNDPWSKGWIYRLGYVEAAKLVPTLPPFNEENPSISDKQKNTEYIFYTSELSDAEKNAWRVNPSYISSIEEISENDFDETTYIIKEPLQSYFNNLETGKIPDGIYRLSDIRIWIEDTEDYQDEDNSDVIADVGYNQALYMNIPASSVPTQVVELSVSDNSKEEIKYRTNLNDKKESTPMRLFYSVGIQDKIKYNDGGIDLTQVDATYLSTHTSDGQVYFTSNYYSNTTYDNYVNEASRTRGDPFVTFSPEVQNRYYVYQDYHVLYEKLYKVVNNNLVDITNQVEEYTEQEITTTPYVSYMSAEIALRNGELKENDLVLLNNTASRILNNDSDYFLTFNYYVGDSNGKARLASFVTKRKGTILGLDTFKNVSRNDLLCWYNPSVPNSEVYDYSKYTETTAPEGYALSAKPGGIRLGDMAQSIDVKGSNIGETYTEANKTGTANNFFLPTISDKTSTGNNVLINVYLGNNGLIKVDNSMLFVTKLVSDKDKNFVTSNEPMAYKKFDYQIYVEGFNGIRSAIKVQWDDNFKLWRRRIATIDALTSNNDFLQDSNYNLIRVNEKGEIYNEPQKEDFSDDQSSDEETDSYEPNEEFSSEDLYYVYIKNDNKGNIENSHVIRVYSATDYDSSAVSGNRVIDETGVYFNVDEVYLIPVNDSGIQEGNWTFHDGIYRSLNNFTIAKIIPEHYDGRTDGMELISSYAIRSEYLKVNLNFGIGSENSDEVDFKAPVSLFDSTPFSVQTSSNSKILNKYTAQFTLKHGEGLLFNTIPSGAYYRVTEKLEEENDPGWKLWDENQSLVPGQIDSQLKVAVKNLKQDYSVVYDNSGEITGAFNDENKTILEGNSLPSKQSHFVSINKEGTSKENIYSIYGATDSKEEGVQYINTSETSNLIIKKSLIKDEYTEINEIDKSTEFNFDLTITCPENMISEIDKNIRYKYGLFEINTNNIEDEITAESWNLIKSGYLISNENQAQNNPEDIVVKSIDDLTYSWPITLSSNQMFVVYDLLIDTEYSLKEVPIDGFKEFTITNENIHSGKIIKENETNENDNQIIVKNIKVNPISTFVNLEGTKNIIGSTNAVNKNLPDLGDQQFSFEITPNSTIDGDPITSNQTVTNDSTGKITFFNNIEYEKAGTYTYIIKEKDLEALENFKKDPTQYKVIVEVKEDYGDETNLQYKGQLKATTKIYKIIDEFASELESPNIEFNNEYTPKPVTLNLEGTKVFEDYKGDKISSLEDFEFRFTINTRDEWPKPNETIVKNNKDGSFNFGPITFTEPGIYNYVIQEDLANRDENIDYDPTIYYVIVTVTDKNGQLEASPEIRYTNANGEKVDKIIFTNKQASGDLTIKKIVQDHSNSEFKFEIKLSDTTINGVFDNIQFTNGIAEITLIDNKEITIHNLPLGVRYAITEINSGKYVPIYSPSNSGIIQRDSSSNTVEVNNRILDPVEVLIQGNKRLINTNGIEMELGDRQFQFILMPNNENPEGDPTNKINQKTFNDIDGTFKFNLSFSQPGTYTYTLLECIDNNQKGYIYDSNSYIIKITVYDDEISNVLKAIQEVTKVTQQGDSKSEANSIEFVNIHAPRTTSFVIGGKKDFKNSRLNGNDFEFILSPILEEGTDNPLKQDITVKNDSNGYFSFESIHFTAVGTYKYKVVEKTDNLPSYINFDNLIYTVIIRIEDVNGELFVGSVTYYSNKSEETKKYEPDSIIFTNSIENTGNLSISKTVLGTNEDKNINFDFKVTLYNNNSQTLNDENLDNLQIATQINGIYGDMNFINGIAQFQLKDSQTKTALNLPVGIYYKVEELSKDEFEVSYLVNRSEGNDKTIYEISDSQNTVDIKNTRKISSPIAYPLSVLKVVENNENCNDTFKFELSLNPEFQDGVELPENKIIEIKGAGEKAFDDIIFTKDGTYNFIVTEDVNTLEPYIVNKSSREVEIVIEKREDSTLYVKSIKVDNNSNITKVFFVNTYLDPIETSIVGKKTLKNENSEELKSLQNIRFKFKLVPDSSNSKEYDPIKEEKFLFNDENGYFMESLSYSHPGQYVYYLTEEKEEDKSGYIFDKSKYKIIIDVNSNLETKKLEITKNITKILNLEDSNLSNEETTIEPESINFINLYSTEGIPVVIEGKKEFRNGELKGEDFEFELIPEDTAPSPQSKKTRNNELGKISFDPIYFTSEGSYKYKVREIKGEDQSNIRYSNFEYDVIITITRKEAGNLEAQVEYLLNNRSVDFMQFTNINIVKSGNLEITKKVFGADPQPNREFNFTITLYNNFELTKEASQINGTYGEITFTNGEAHFRLKDGEVQRIDDLPLDLFYKVEEEEDKDFSIRAYRNSGSILENNTIEIMFINLYKNFDYISYTPTIEKIVNGYPLEDDTFTFELLEAKDNPEGCLLPSNKVTSIVGQGETQFEPIQFYLPGKYTFTIQETNLPTNYTSDKNTANFTVEILLDENSWKLSLGEISYGAGNYKNQIINTYLTPVEAKLTGSKKLIGSNNEEISLKNQKFTFALESNPNNPIWDPVMQGNKYTTNDQDGAFEYNLTYTHPGKYLYTLKEIADSSGYIYDPSYYIVEINVSINSESNTLILDKKIFKDDTEIELDNLTFENVSNPEIVSVIIEGTKTFENSTLNGKDFTFVLESINSEENNELKKVANNINGHFNFGTLIFSKPGIYKYKVFEESSNDPYILYSDYLYEVTVNVTETLDERLEATVYYQLNNSIVKNISFVNKLKTGDLVISKTVSGNDGDKTKDFNFEVSLDTSINGQYGDMTFENGVSTFSLKDGESKTAQNLPLNIKYTVMELDSEDYIVTSSCSNNSVTGNSTISDMIVEGENQVSFNNYRDSFGNLSISKTVDDPNKNINQDFDFVVTLYRDQNYNQIATEINGNYNGINFTNGRANFRLKDQQTVVIQNLPVNLYYIVQETNSNGYISQSSGNTGRISKNTTPNINFINKKVGITPISYPIGIQKNVVGNSGNNDTFTFALRLVNSNSDGVILPTNTITSLQGSGKAFFDNITFTKAGIYVFAVSEINLPANYKVDTSEHTVTIVVEERNNSLVLSNLVVDKEDSNIVFTNTYEESNITTPNVGVMKLHAKADENYHNQLNEVTNNDSLWYLLRIENKGNATAHNLVISDSIPGTLELTGQSYITKERGSESNRVAMDMIPNYDSDQRLLKISSINDQAISLNPGESINIEYEAKVPDNLDQEVYWTNHAWITYDELNSENAIKQAANQTASALALSYNSNYEDLMNFDKIDEPIELEAISPEITHYHSKFYNELAELEETHIKYANDVREHYNIVGTEIPEDPNNPEDPSNTPTVPDTPQNPEEPTDNPNEPDPGTQVPDEPSVNPPIPDENGNTNIPGNSDNKEIPNQNNFGDNTIINQNTVVNNSTTITQNSGSPKTGITEWKVIGMFAIIILCIALLSLNYMNSKRRD